MNKPSKPTVFTTDVVFTPSVVQVQNPLGSRDRMQQLLESGRWPTTITDDLAQFFTTRRSIFLGTASADGRPNTQHRGGAKGFLMIVGAVIASQTDGVMLTTKEGRF